MGLIRKGIKEGAKGSFNLTKGLIQKKMGKFEYTYCSTGQPVPPEMTLGSFTQDSEGNIIFSKRSNNVYKAVGYWWAGPEFSVEQYYETEGSKRHALLVAGGALVGDTMHDSSFGLLAGGLIGNMMSSGPQAKLKKKKTEVQTPAILTFRNIFTQQEYSLGFLCDRKLNKRIINEIDSINV